MAKGNRIKDFFLSHLSRKMAKKKRGPKKTKKISRKKAVKKFSKKPTPNEEKFVVGFEEVVVRCPSCGKEFRIVKSSSFSTEGMLCQRCAAGGGMGLEEDSDF